MVEDPQQDLSPTELEILKKLWDRNEGSVRDVHEALEAQHPRAYSTTKTIMDRMVRKGILDRRRKKGVFVYRPEISRPQGLAGMVRRFAERVLEADPAAVVPLFVQAGRLDEDELEELENLLAEAGTKP